MRRCASRWQRLLVAGAYTLNQSPKQGVNVHKKIRGKTATLYRSSWVPKGTSGNTHGYAVQNYVGSIPVDSQDIPAALRELLTPDEITYLMSTICIPAVEEATRLKRRTELRERDPCWRLDDAARLVGDAALRSADWPVPGAKTAAVLASLLQVRTTDASSAGVAQALSDKSDPLTAALAMLKTAVQAVTKGHYGSAPTEGVRSTQTYKLWAEIFETVTGSETGCLMRALQDKGFAKTRQR
jgi:hypothetical protein